MNKYYLAIRGCEPIEVQFKTNITQSTLDCYIKQYGMDFIGLYEDYETAMKDIELDNYFFDSLASLDLIDTINYLERCYQLEYKEV